MFDVSRVHAEDEEPQPTTAKIETETVTICDQTEEPVEKNLPYDYQVIITDDDIFYASHDDQIDEDCISEEELIIEPGLTSPDLVLDLDDYLNVQSDGEIFQGDVACDDPVVTEVVPAVTTPLVELIEKQETTEECFEEETEAPVTEVPIQATTPTPGSKIEDHSAPCEDYELNTEEPWVPTSMEAKNQYETTEGVECEDDPVTEEIERVATTENPDHYSPDAGTDCIEAETVPMEEFIGDKAGPPEFIIPTPDSEMDSYDCVEEYESD